jgi:hypothetical protein
MTHGRKQGGGLKQGGTREREGAPQCCPQAPGCPAPASGPPPACACPAGHCRPPLHSRRSVLSTLGGSAGPWPSSLCAQQVNAALLCTACTAGHCRPPLHSMPSRSMPPSSAQHAQQVIAALPAQQPLEEEDERVTWVSWPQSGAPVFQAANGCRAGRTSGMSSLQATVGQTGQPGRAADTHSSVQPLMLACH